MNTFRKFLVFLILVCLCLTACGGEVSPTAPSDEDTEPAQTVDYAASVKLDMSSETVKQEVTVKTFVDGDTTHFYVPESVMEGGVLKARYLAIDTPESTGKIEEFGKKASQFTREKLSNAESILIESETDGWNADSTGDRYLVWVWYKPVGAEEYRNLNIEILQNGLAIANSASGNRYGETCVAAIDQAKREKLNLYSGEPDPDFYYGEAIELTLKELRTNIQSYSGMKVAFSGVVTANSGTQGVYVESPCEETGMYFGMYVYYGHSLNGAGLDALSVGNEVRIVGTVQYYEAGGTWQVSDVSYRLMDPNDPNNVQKLSSGHAPAYFLVKPELFIAGVDIPNGASILHAPWAQLALGTSVEVRDLEVMEVYTTDKEDSSSSGAMTITCKAGDITVTVRTSVLLDENGQRITADAYLGKTIDVKGIVDYFDGVYQIRVFSADNITIK